MKETKIRFDIIGFHFSLRGNKRQRIRQSLRTSDIHGVFTKDGSQMYLQR